MTPNDVLIQLAVEAQKIAQQQTDEDGNFYLTIQQLHNIIGDLQEVHHEK